MLAAVVQAAAPLEQSATQASPVIVWKHLFLERVRVSVPLGFQLPRPS